MTPEEIRQRAAAIRLPVKELAAAAGVDEDSAHRVLKGRSDPRLSTIEKLSDAVKDEEDRLREHLAEIGGGEQ